LEVFKVGRPQENRHPSSRGPASIRGAGAPAKIFISYRREGGAEMARLIRDALQRRGYRVFMDVEDLRSGPFNTALLAEIEAATDVVVVLTPECLERCSDPNDWLRREVAHAIQREKNVVPVMTRGFRWPLSLPEDLAALPTFQGVPPSLEYFEASMDKLARLLQGRCPSNHRPPGLAVAVASGMAVLLLVVALVRMMPHGEVARPDGFHGPQIAGAFLTGNDLLDSTNAPQGFLVSLQTADGRKNYREGEHIGFVVQATRDCFITLISIDSDGEMILLLPNAWQRRAFIPRGEPVAIPPKASGFRFPIKPPHGRTLVKAIATLRPLVLSGVTDQSFRDQDFPPLEKGVKAIGLEGDPSRVQAEVESKLYDLLGPSEWSTAELVLITQP
jgi:hypothetical protein